MNLAAATESLLRAREPDRYIASTRAWQLVLLLVLACFVYGAVMGGFALRPLQMLYSALKVPMCHFGSW